MKHPVNTTVNTTVKTTVNTTVGLSLDSGFEVLFLSFDIFAESWLVCQELSFQAIQLQAEALYGIDGILCD